MKRMRTLVGLLCSCALVLFGTQIAFADTGAMIAEMLLTVIEKMHSIVIVEWWVSGGIFLIGLIYAVVFVLRGSKNQNPKTRKEV